MIKYRLATESDNEQLIALAAASAMSGDTSLRIDRKPDFFKLLNMRGDSKVFIAENNEAIVGCLCASLQQVYIGKEIFPVHYIGDFKVMPELRGSGIGIQLCNELATYLLSVDADLAFLTVAKGNPKPFSFFKGWAGIPDFENTGSFLVHQFAGMRGRHVETAYKIDSTAVNDEVLEFLNNYYRGYELGSVITKEKLQDADIFVIRQEERIAAAVCLVDTMNAKQNVVMKMSAKNKLLIGIVNALQRPLGISKMPVINEAVRMMYIKYLATDAEEEHFVKPLINHSRRIAFDKAYSFVSLGLHEKDQLNKFLPGFPKFTFYATGMFLSIKNNKFLIEKVKNGIPFEDFSLV